MDKNLAKHLLKKYASYQKKELRRIDYPAQSPMFKEYTSGYRTETAETKADLNAEKVGLALAIMKPGLVDTPWSSMSYLGSKPYVATNIEIKNE